MKRVVVVGGGVGGLSAAVVLARRGVPVTVCEASPFFGGLASALDAGGVRFDGGPYILLDPPGLSWAFDALGLSLDDLELRRVLDVYRVDGVDGPPVHVLSDLEQTIDGIEDSHPGQGVRYGAFVDRVARIHAALAPLQTRPRPSAWSLLRAGALRHATFLTRSLGTVLRRAGFTPPVARAVAIWTHVAGQDVRVAPSPLALVPAMIHGQGCFVPARGVAAVPERVLARAREVGVTLRSGARVRRILTDARRVTGVELVDGETLDASAVVSDASGVATLLELAPAPARVRTRVAALPLQSPGVAAYVLADDRPSGAYLRFRYESVDGQPSCRLIVRPSALPGTPADLVAHPTRVVAPLAHAVAERLDEVEQGALLDRVLAEPWTRQSVGPFHEVARLVPASWGRRHALHRDSMNPTMTAKFMRQGRLPHRIAEPEGLFLVGSSTHPGQWVSFCLISGILGARELLRWWDGRGGPAD